MQRAPVIPFDEDDKETIMRRRALTFVVTSATAAILLYQLVMRFACYFVRGGENLIGRRSNRVL